ncbi:MAG: hypothetical protein IPK31_03310 [Chitinophagaceae bacterium]|nr:hypothetical protein [Chitinophagaceae bacterium]
MQKELQQKTQIEEIGRHIGFEAGEEMVKRFFDKNPEEAFANILGKNLFAKILAQPGCVGIAIVPGYNSAGIRQSVLVGVDANRKPILEYTVVTATGEMLLEEGMIGDDGAVVHDGWGAAK